MFPAASAAMPSGFTAPAGRVANPVAGLRIQASADGAIMSDSTSATMVQQDDFMAILLQRFGRVALATGGRGIENSTLAPPVFRRGCDSSIGWPRPGCCIAGMDGNPRGGTELWYARSGRPRERLRARLQQCGQRRARTQRNALANQRGGQGVEPGAAARLDQRLVEQVALRVAAA